MCLNIHKCINSTSNTQVYTHRNGTGPIWLDNMICRGSESGIDMCSHNGWGIHNCGHSEDVGIRCYGSKQQRNGKRQLFLCCFT